MIVAAYMDGGAARAGRGRGPGIRTAMAVTVLLGAGGGAGALAGASTTHTAIAVAARKVNYCTRHHHPRGCINVPKAAKRPHAVNQQGSHALTPHDVENGGG